MEIKFSHYGEEREVNATNEELEMFETLKNTTGLDLRLTRKSDSYVTAMYGDWDLARFKFTPRAKWIAFPVAEVGSVKHRITVPEDAAGFGELLDSSIQIIEKH